jgi:sugar lactone lactonase YvrE
MEKYSISPHSTGIGFAEALRWRDGLLWFSDCHTRYVSYCGPDGAVTRRSFVPAQPCGLGWGGDESLLVVSMWDRSVLAFSASGVARVATLGFRGAGPCNDLISTSAGNAYVGCIGFDIMVSGPLPDNQPSSRLALVRRDGEVSWVADDLQFPNGMAFSSDERVLIVAETAADRLTAFDVNPDGSLRRKRTFAEVPDGSGPDGIAMDRNGAVWVACFKSGEFLRVEEGGKITGIIEADPARIAIACAVGGHDGTVLFCSTAASDMAERHERPTGQIGVVST